jgi:hypothetical protein
MHHSDAVWIMVFLALAALALFWLLSRLHKRTPPDNGGSGDQGHDAVSGWPPVHRDHSRPNRLDLTHA